MIKVYKLLNKNILDEILFQGEILKLSPLTSSSGTHSNKYYSTKFLIFTKREFR